MSKRKLFGGVAAASLAAVIAAASPTVVKWEGIKLNAYRDPVGIPTVCVGETAGVKMGDSYSRQECMTMLDGSLAKHLNGMRACTKVALPEKAEGAFLSFTYNLGVGTYCRNIARRINEGNIEGACRALGLYVYAGGKKLRGLENRRAEEVKLCLEGLTG